MDDKQRAISPTTGELVGEYDAHDAAAVDAKIAAASAAFRDGRSGSFEGRARVLVRAAELMRERRDALARLMAVEMGKPIREGRAEVDKCAWVCEHYAEHGALFLANEETPSDARRSFVAFRPLGPVLAVMPWNFPFWQVFRFAAPALMAGNAGLLKHASNVPGCALAIEDVFREAGLADGLFTTLLVDSTRVENIISDRRVVAVTLTGSTPAGRSVAASAGAALKKTVLELGGSDPFVVLEDADLEAAARIGAQSRLLNCGQSCIAAKRFIVVEAVREAFVERFVDVMSRSVVGDPLREETTVGPQARADLRDELASQVERSVRAGARVAMSAKIADGPGAFYPPSVLTDVAPGMPAYDEELFGPVAAVIAAANEDEAIRIANDTSFGLGAAVFTGDHARGTRIAETRLEAGACFVNSLVKSDPRLPFGGIKESGYGRELGSFGIREFVNVKSVYVD
jgi:succinate-semialdehyde dehydrogenase/glutarate-semialdehyde dehydrogenase